MLQQRYGAGWGRWLTALEFQGQRGFRVAPFPEPHWEPGSLVLSTLFIPTGSCPSRQGMSQDWLLISKWEEPSVDWEEGDRCGTTKCALVISFQVELLGEKSYHKL